MKQLNIIKVTTADVLPLYTDYAGQESRAYLCLDTRDGDVYVREQAPHNNGCSQDEFSGHVRRWQIPNNLTATGVTQLLSDPDVLKDLQIVLQDAEEYYDGSNYRTGLNEDGREASQRLEYSLSYAYDGGYESLNPVCASHYLDASTYSDLMSYGDTHEAIAERIVKEAIRDGYLLSAVDVENVLEEMTREAE